MKHNTKTRKTLPVFAFIVFGVLLIIYLGERSKSIPLDQEGIDSSGIVRIEEKIKAPDFVLKDLTGRSVRLRDLRGNLVMINFWTTW